MAAPPSTQSSAPSGMTVTIDAGETVTFSMQANDSDGNLSGAEWYGPQEQPFVQLATAAGGNGTSATFSRTYTFSDAGSYPVSVVAFDAIYEYGEPVDWTVEVLSDQPNTAPAVVLASPGTSLPTIQKGDPLTIQLDVSDVDGNIMGVEWYGMGDNPNVQLLAQASGDAQNAVFSRTYQFPFGGIYQLVAAAFDADYAYANAIDLYVTVEGNGEDFSSTPQSATGERGLFVDRLADIIATPTSMDKALAAIQSHNISRITLYGLEQQVANKPALVEEFVCKAHALGVNSVGAAGGASWAFDDYASYNASAATQGQFDALYLEYEFWNTDNFDPTQFNALLDHMRQVGGNMEVNAYLGYVVDPADPNNPSELAKYQTIASRIDNLYLHCYVKDASVAYDTCKPRFEAWGTETTGVNIWPIYSAEWRNETDITGIVHACDDPPWGPEEYCFMGKWLAYNGLQAAETVFLQDIGEETETWKQNLDLKGFYYFALAHLDDMVGSPETPVYSAPHNCGTSSPAGVAPVLNASQPSYTTEVAIPVTLDVTADDADGDLEFVEWYGNGDNPYSESASAAGGSGSSTVFFRTHTFNTEGNYTISVVGYDFAGNVSDVLDIPVTVTPIGAGNSPQLQQVSPPTNLLVAPGSTVELIARATDANSNLRGAEWYGNGDNGAVQLIENVGGTGTQADFLKRYTFMSAGSYPMSVVAFDEDYNYSSPVDWSVTVSNAICAAPYVQGSSYSEGIIVSHTGSNYRCERSQRCSSSSPQYEPGAGSRWTQGWQTLGSCTAP